MNDDEIEKIKADALYSGVAIGRVREILNCSPNETYLDGARRVVRERNELATSLEEVKLRLKAEREHSQMISNAFLDIDTWDECSELDCALAIECMKLATYIGDTGSVYKELVRGGDEEKWIGFARTMSRRDQSETQLSSELWRQVFSGHCIGWCYFDFELDDELPF